MIVRNELGTQTISLPSSNALRAAVATFSGVVDIGTLLIDSVILVFTNPGLTTVICMGVFQSASEKPSENESSPALEEP